MLRSRRRPCLGGMEGREEEARACGLRAGELERRFPRSAFEWRVRWPLVGLSVVGDDLEGAVLHARAMRDPLQARMPEGLDHLLGRLTEQGARGLRPVGARRPTNSWKGPPGFAAISDDRLCGPLGVATQFRPMPRVTSTEGCRHHHPCPSLVLFLSLPSERRGVRPSLRSVYLLALDRGEGVEERRERWRPSLQS